MRISLIAAMARNRVIGKDNQMPWHLPADLKYFKSVTTGKPVVMGRKTFQSIGRPLPHRRNIVISRDESFAPLGCEVVGTPQEAMKLVGEVEEAMIIGGGQIYQYFMPLATDLYITLVDAAPDGDAFFPEWPEEFKVVHSQKHQRDGVNQYDCEFLHLSR